MRRRTMALATAMVLLATRMGAAQQKPDEQATPAEPELRIPELPHHGELVVIDDHWWTTLLSDEPQLKLKEAAEKLRAGDAKAGALDMRKAAAHTRVAVARSKGEIKDDLVASVRELDALARRIENAEAIPPDSLTLSFARDLQALAAHHAEKASQHWAGGSAVKTGYDLKAAALDLQAAVEWANSDDLPRVATLAAAAEKEADRLIEDEKAPHDPVAPLLTQIQERVNALRGTLRRE